MGAPARGTRAMVTSTAKNGPLVASGARSRIGCGVGGVHPSYSRGCRSLKGARSSIVESFNFRHTMLNDAHLDEDGMTKRRGTSGKACAVYHRVSTAQQGDPKRVLADLRRAAGQRGYSVAIAEAERGSGARNDRPGLQRVLEAARRGEISAVLVTRLDRFGRSAPDLLANIRALRDAGCEFIAIEQGLHVQPNGDAVSQLLLTVLSGVAEFEREIIRDRVLEGQRRARERGVHLGRPRDDGPDAAAVRRLRRAKRSWSEVADELGCSVAMARRRATDEAVKRGAR